MKVYSSVILSDRERRSSAVSLPQFKYNDEFPTVAVFLKRGFKYSLEC